MLRFVTLLLTSCVLVSCYQIEAVSPPYFNGVFVGYYLTGDEAEPVGMRLELQASSIEQKRYNITGTVTLGEESFNAEGYEVASLNLDYLAPQAPPPPMGDSIIEFKDKEGTTAYTLCTSLIYEDYEGFFRVARMNFFAGPPLDESVPIYCIGQKGAMQVELAKQ